MPDAPVCNVKGVSVPPTPDLPSLRPIGRATDLPSALRAIQNLTQNFNIIYNMYGPPAGGGTPNRPPPGGSATTKPKKSTWKEVRDRRVTKNVTIKSDADPSQSIELEQIDSFTMQDTTTGALFTWTR